MPEQKLEDISKKMRHLDICMMTTSTEGNQLASRPMSNNGDVEYDGNSYFFSSDKQDVIRDLEKNPHVNLSFAGEKKLYISVVGEAELIRDRAEMKKHWQDSLEQWFEDGVDTPGIVMIHVKGKRIKYWQNWDSGEVKL